ncbi:MAG: histidine kinase dimerization/phospho-acceptor domain-containing protein, partial [Terriglobia bacterium]
MKAELHKETCEDLAPPKPLTGLDLLSALVHELSQPLTVLMGEFELAASYPPEVAEYHDLVERSLTEV